MNFEDDEEIIKRAQSDDLLFEAYDEPVKKEAIKLAKKSLDINPENIDAENFITKFETDTIKKLKKYKKTLDKEHAKLQGNGTFDKKNIGIFWSLIGTRPYMRTKYCYMLTLIELGRYSEAIKQGEEFLELCENDNQGIRYILMGLYVMLEKFEECKELCRKYFENSVFMLLPLAIMYYKEGDYKNTKKVLNKVQENNKYILKYINNDLKFSKSKIKIIEEEETYSFGSEEEAYFVIRDYKYLLQSVPAFKEFIEKEIELL